MKVWWSHVLPYTNAVHFGDIIFRHWVIYSICSNKESRKDNVHNFRPLNKLVYAADVLQTTDNRSNPKLDWRNHKCIYRFTYMLYTHTCHAIKYFKMAFWNYFYKLSTKFMKVWWKITYQTLKLPKNPNQTREPSITCNYIWRINISDMNGRQKYMKIHKNAIKSNDVL